jgi:hypothetical protein
MAKLFEKFEMMRKYLWTAIGVCLVFHGFEIVICKFFLRYNLVFLGLTYVIPIAIMGRWGVVALLSG